MFGYYMNEWGLCNKKCYIKRNKIIKLIHVHLSIFTYFNKYKQVENLTKGVIRVRHRNRKWHTG